MLSKTTRLITLSLLLAILVAYTAGNFIWLKMDRGYGWDDTVTHSTIALILKDTGKLEEYMKAYYPPLAYYLMALGNKVSGRRDQTGSLSVIMPLSVLIFMLGMYLLGARLAGPWAAIAAMLLTMTNPAFFHLSRLSLLEFPVTAMLVIVIALVVYSDLFQNRRYAVLAGVSAGCGMLIKQTLAAYFLFPVIVAAAVGLLTVKNKKEVLVNLLLSGLCCFLICGIWYAPRSARLIKDYISAGLLFTGAAEHVEPLFSRFSVTYVWIVLKDLCLNPFYLAVFFVSAVYTLLRLKEKRRDLMILLAVIAGTYLWITIIRSKTHKLVIPELPFIYLIITAGIASLKSGYLRAGIFAVLLTAGGIRYFSTGFGTPSIPLLETLLKPVLISNGPDLWKPYAPVEENDVLLVLEDIARDKGSKKSVTIGAFGGSNSFTQLQSVLFYVSKVNELAFDEIFSVRSTEDIDQRCYDYVVVYKKAFVSSKYVLIAKYDNGLSEGNGDDSMSLYKKAL